MRKLIDVRGSKFVYAKNKLICLDPVCLDIETSNNHADKVEDLVTWISSIQVYFRGCYFLLRKPEELIAFYNYLYAELDLMQQPPHADRIVYTYIHNSSYDLSYLIPYFQEYLPKIDGQLQGLIDNRNKILTYTQGCLEWRCTFRLTQLSLATWTKEMNVEHRKKVGIYDYDRIIYQDTELTDNEQAYDRNDVLGLFEALMKQNEMNKEDITQMPLTLTGYVRRDLRRACLKNKYFRQNNFLKTRLDYELYYAFLKSFSGGFTHNNRYYKNITIKAGDTVRFMNKDIYVPIIKHGDFKSHYPTQMTCYDFPIGKPQMIYDSMTGIRDPMTIEEILDYYPQFYTMSIIRLYKAELISPDISMPFMQYSKCQECSFFQLYQDNGRITYARGQWIMFLDNLTLQILSEQYDLEYEVLKVWKMKAGKLPKEIIDTIDKYFKGKSDTKQLYNELEEKYGVTDNRTFEAGYRLSTNKKMLNSIYGCTATNPLRLSYEIRDNMEFRIKEFYSSKEEITAGLDKYYSKWNNFLPYQVGCIVTARARFELYEFIKAVGYDKVLYCDTDSIFYIGDDETIQAINALNEQKRKTAHSVILDNGKVEYYDEFSSELDCVAFRGLHSKCYGLITADKEELKITIAGVPPRSVVGMTDDDKPIYLTREQEMQEMQKGVPISPYMALDKLSDDYTFYINTGLSAVYIGATGGIDGLRKPTIINIDGHEISTAGGCVLKRLESKKVHDIEYDFTNELADLNAFGLT